MSSSFTRFPSYRATILGIIISISYAIIGTVIGSVWLMDIHGSNIYVGVRSIYFIHPEIQYYGFLTFFIVSVSATLVPLFYGRGLKPGFIYLVLSLGSIGLTLHILSRLYHVEALYGASYLIYYGAIAIYSLRLLTIIRFNNRVFLPGDLFISTSFITLILILTLRLLSLYRLFRYNYLDPGIIYLLLLGFPASMIYGVMIRTFKFKFHIFNRGVGLASYMIHVAGIGSIIFAIFSGEYLLIIPSSTLFLASGALFIYSVNMFEWRPGEQYRARMGERDWVRYRYLTSHLSTGGLWLLTGLSAGIIYSIAYQGGWAIPGLIYLRDIFIHSMLVGFIASIILGYAGYMLPPLLFRRLGYRHLSIHPLILLNSGNILRILGDILGYYNIKAQVFGLSGFMILASIILGLGMIHRQFRS